MQIAPASAPPVFEGASPADPDPAFGLYVHWPFCRTKCPYCDFNSHVAGEIEHERWARALVRELDHFAAETGRRRLASIFFGGGTPSLMAPATCAAVIERAAERFELADEVEITLEANPNSLEAARLAAFKAAGVNRVSLGVQALNDTDLRFLGREHSAAEALGAVELVARLFPRFSFDLIYARPGQTPVAWAAELERALAWAGGHLSVYQLTIEPGTRFHGLHARGALALPADGVQAELFELTQERLEAAGLPAYEISNHARPGEECRHNLVYWRSGEWIGIGPGAHGRLNLDGGRVATETARMPRAWLEQVERCGHAERPYEPVSPADQVIELLLMGLGLTEGVSIRRLEALSGAPLDRTIDGGALEHMVADSLMTIQDGRIAATRAGRERLDGLIAALIGT